MRPCRSARAVSSCSSRIVRGSARPLASALNSSGRISRSPALRTGFPGALALTHASMAPSLPASSAKSVIPALPRCEEPVKGAVMRPTGRVHSGPMSDMRLAILDSDSGFVRVLVKRAGDLGWQLRRLEAAPRPEEFIAMRVNALVVDPALLGPGATE